MRLDYDIARSKIAADNGAPEMEADLATDAVVIPVKLCNLPPLNAIANEVLAMSADPDTDLGRLSAMLRRDPAFAADVMFLANSSLFGFPQRMYSLRHAIAILGLDRIRALAVTVAMRGFVRKSSPVMHQCWQHSAACALISEKIAPAFGIASEVAYTVGLLHDIGLLGFLKCYPGEAASVLGKSFDDIGQALAAERVALNVDHARAGAWLVKTWGLPPSFAECCEHHHEPVSAKDDNLLAVVKVGCRIAGVFGLTAFRFTNPPLYEDVVASVPKPQRGMFPPGDELRAGVEARLAMFQ